MATTVFHRGVDNAYSLVDVADALDNVTDPLTFAVTPGEGAGFDPPAGFPVIVTISSTLDPGLDPDMEKAYLTAIATDDLTIDRPNAIAHPGTPYVQVLFTEENLTEVQDEIKQLQGELWNQVAHGFALATPAIYRKTDGTFAKAKADADATTGVYGVVSEIVDADNFRVTTGGRIPSGLVFDDDGVDYVLSDVTAGLLVTWAARPTAEGSFIAPVLIGTGGGSGLVRITTPRELPEGGGGGGGGGGDSFLLQAPQFTSIATVVNCNTILPYDDTIPQNTEGTEVLTLAITPTSATSNLVIEVLINCGIGGNGELPAMALFQDSTAGALAAMWGSQAPGASENTCQMSLFHEMVSGTTSATTFKIRVGPTSPNSIYVNGNKTGGRIYGGVQRSWIRITEYAAP